MDAYYIWEDGRIIASAESHDRVVDHLLIVEDPRPGRLLVILQNAKAVDAFEAGFQAWHQVDVLVATNVIRAKALKR